MRRSALGCGAALLVLASGLGWLYFFGHHRHVLELGRADRQRTYPGTPDFRLTSRRSPFVLATPDEPNPHLEGGFGYQRSQHYASGDDVAIHAQARALRGICLSTQSVYLPESKTSCAFTIDGIAFTLTLTELRGAGRTWPRPTSGTVEVLVDDLVPR